MPVKKQEQEVSPVTLETIGEKWDRLQESESRLAELQKEHAGLSEQLKARKEETREAKERIAQARDDFKSGLISESQLESVESKYSEIADGDSSELRDKVTALETPIAELESEVSALIEEGLTDLLRFRVESDKEAARLLSEVRERLARVGEIRKRFADPNGSRIEQRWCDVHGFKNPGEAKQAGAFRERWEETCEAAEHRPCESGGTFDGYAILPAEFANKNPGFAGV